MPRILLDTGVWIALCDRTDRSVSPKVARALERRIAPHRVILPWPIAYETLRTRFVRNRIALQEFEKKLTSPRLDRQDDSRYREPALMLSLDASLRQRRPLAMVDCMLRLVIEDPNVNLRYFATFNARDFSDVCARRGIEMWCN